MVKKLIQTWLLVSGLLIVLNSCATQNTNTSNWGKAAMKTQDWLPDMPKSIGYKRLFLRGIPDGEDVFSHGWRQGCDQSLRIVGQGRMRLLTVGFDVARYEQDPLYRQGYNMGSSYCSLYLDYN
jgi:hypothetical protein